MNQSTANYALILVPTPLSQGQPKVSVLSADLERIRATRTWLVETAKVARAALKTLEHPGPISELTIIEIEKLANDKELHQCLLEHIKTGDIGVMSDAGCPGIADPGARVCAAGHQLGVPVHPLVGPSSIMLALMASGLNGQQFRFHGYLPVQDDDRKKWIAQTEKTSIEIAKAGKKPTAGQAVSGEAQIAIETPYRNQAFFDALLKTLNPSTQLCLAMDITGPAELIHTKTVADWRAKPLALEKIPTIFLWQARQ